MKELAEKAIHGDVDAFLELMDRNSLSMYKVARGILNQDDTIFLIHQIQHFLKFKLRKRHFLAGSFLEFSRKPDLLIMA